MSSNPLDILFNFIKLDLSQIPTDYNKKNRFRYLTIFSYILLCFLVYLLRCLSRKVSTLPNIFNLDCSPLNPWPSYGSTYHSYSLSRL